MARELATFRRHPVERRRFVAAPVRADLTVAEIVDVDDDQVGPWRIRSAKKRGSERQGEPEQG
jgi:hypothetical protein